MHYSFLDNPKTVLFCFVSKKMSLVIITYHLNTKIDFKVLVATTTEIEDWIKGPHLYNQLA